MQQQTTRLLVLWMFLCVSADAFRQIPTINCTLAYHWHQCAMEDLGRHFHTAVEIGCDEPSEPILVTCNLDADRAVDFTLPNWEEYVHCDCPQETSDFDACPVCHFSSYALDQTACPYELDLTDRRGDLGQCYWIYHNPNSSTRQRPVRNAYGEQKDCTLFIVEPQCQRSTIVSANAARRPVSFFSFRVE